MNHALEMSNMHPEHRFVMSNLEFLIKSFIRNVHCVVLREAKYQWAEFEEKFEPDISLLCGFRHRKKLCYTDVPRFVAEVLSDSTEENDRNKKKHVYETIGVEEYWLVDWRVPGGSVERYILDDAGETYILHDIIEGRENEEQEINLLTFPNIVFSMKDLMEHVGEDIL